MRKVDGGLKKRPRRLKSAQIFLPLLKIPVGRYVPPVCDKTFDMGASSNHCSHCILLISFLIFQIAKMALDFLTATLTIRLDKVKISKKIIQYHD